uniref:Uncharacterized protein n=1 Tax=Ignisphaera aggregans TaxID=334771 RepID=A0A7C5UVR8_9CREN
MGRDIHALLAIIFTVIIAMANASAYTYITTATFYKTDQELYSFFKDSCYGFIELRVFARSGDVICYTEWGEPVYESIDVYLDMSIGSWYIDIGRLYYKSPVRGVAEVVVEKPAKLINITLIIERENSIATYIDISKIEKKALELKSPESIYSLKLVIKANQPGKEIVRIGFYLKST